MIKILYIEDDSAHIELTSRSLENSGAQFNLQTASTIADAFSLLKNNEYDVILSDYRLPDGSGLDVINIANNQNISTAIVLITNQEDINTAIAALKAGAVDYIVKQSDYLLKLPIVLGNAFKHTQLEKQKKAFNTIEDKYRNIYENAVEGIFQSSVDGRFIRVNPAMAIIYGYTSSDDMVNSVANINKQIYVSTENRTKFIESLNSYGFVENYEAQNLRKDGSIIWTSTNARAVKDKHGNTIYIEGFLKDITEKKQAEKLLERQLKALTVLHAASIAGTRSDTEAEIIEQVTQIVASIYPNVCGVLLLNDRGDTLTPHPSYIGANILNWENGYPITDGITGRAVRMGNSIRINDITKDMDYIEISSETKSEICIPFRVHQHIIGVFNVESNQANAFDEEDERLLNTIAAGLGTAIEKLRLSDAEKVLHQRETAMLDLIIAAASSLDLDLVLQSILNQLIKLIPSDAGSIQILDGDHLNILAAIGNESLNLAIRGPLLLSDFPLNNYVIIEKKTLRVENVFLDERFQPLDDMGGMRSFLGIPLITKDKIIGMITLNSYQISHFTEQDADLGFALANQAAIAIENARVYQQESRRSQLIEALANIANDIAVIREVVPALDIIAQHTLTLLHASSVAIYIIQEDNETFKILSAKGEYQKELLFHTRKIDEGITGNIIASGKPEIIDDVSKDPRKAIIPGTPIEDINFESMMSAPLILHGEAIGAINVWRSKSDGVFDNSELNFLVSITHQTSISIESIRLFEETTRRAQEAAAIAEVARDITATLQLDILLERIAKYAIILLKGETSAVYLSALDNSHLQAIAAIGIDSDAIKNYPIQIGSGILGDIALKRYGEIVNNAVTDPRMLTIDGTENNPEEHIMGVPVLSKVQLTGLLAVWRSGTEKKFKATDLDFLSSLAQQASVAIENARLFEAEHKRRQEAEILSLATSALANNLDINNLFENILDWLEKIAPYDSASIFELKADHIRATASRGITALEKSPDQIFPSNTPLFNIISETGEPLIIKDCEKDLRFGNFMEKEKIRGWMGVPLITRGRVIGYITLVSHTPNAFSTNDAKTVQTFAHQAANSLENSRLYTETIRRLEELEIVSRVSYALRAAHDTNEMIPILLNEIKTMMETDTAAIWLYNSEKNELLPIAASGWLKDLPKSTFKPNEGIVGAVYSTGTIHISPELTKDPLMDSENTNFFSYGLGGITIPIRTVSETIGVLAVSMMAQNKLEENNIRLITTLTEIAGNAIYRSNLFEKSEEQIRRLTTLREIDTAIISSFDLHITLDILTEHLLTKMGVSAATILVFNPDSLTLSYYAPTGFKNRDNVNTPQNLGDGLAGEILLNRKAIFIKDLSKEPQLLQSKPLISEGFVSYYGMPLFSKGAIKGILETYFRIPFSPSADWMDFLHTLGEQAIIATDNAQLFENLQRSNQELLLAYDTTLEGWGKALEFRNKETQGHTNRVTTLTLKLARQMDISETDLLHIRRGALVHDIGKMGVPDKILLKSGPLTKTEWIEMHKHPIYAYDLLDPIVYLRPALDIAYCHHEWWDGSGYPRGLKGEEIPLSARIFAIVDVWDALLSDRPYRPAWSHTKVMKYIKGLSNKQFDPKVVRIFCKLIESESEYRKRNSPKIIRKAPLKKSA